MNIKQTIPESHFDLYLEFFCNSGYDSELMRMDINNNNFNTDNIEDYNKINIIETSIVNGQYTQAKMQCIEYHLDYRTVLADMN